jgi:tetratricopeptide (TPR) repeat protein
MALALPAVSGSVSAEDIQDAQDAWMQHQSECSLGLAEGRYAQAAGACRAAANVAGRLESGHHLDASLNDLAMAYLHLPRYPEAEQTLSRILDHRTKTLGPEHILTAGTMSLLAATYRKMGRNEAARQIEDRIQKITGACRSQLSDELREQIADAAALDPCTPESIPQFLQ